MKQKIRLDALLVSRGLAPSRQRAQALIGAGQVRVGGAMADKAGREVDPDCLVTLAADPCPYVSRGGLKLAAGLVHFRIEVAGRSCLDVGASTGGFTDCLLQHGARRVYAVDVGYGQLDWRLRQDPRVVVMERTNARQLTRDLLPELVSLATVDASFISLTLILPVLLPLFDQAVSILALVKPQFEVGKGRVGKGGVVRDPQLHAEVLAGVAAHAEGLGLVVHGSLPAPIRGPKGNQEFLMHLTGAVTAAR
ncbi:MAG: TlyA family RNA methyltransferase [Thermodesulfobacteriota bacterium]